MAPAKKKTDEAQAAAAKLIADKLAAAAEIAANVKREADVVAAEIKVHDAEVAAEVKASDAVTAANVKSLEWWKVVFVPLISALIAGLIVAVPSSISAWRSNENTVAKIDAQSREIQEVKETSAATHVLVNSGSLLDLKMIADLSHWKAEQTGSDMDIDAAAAADKAVAEHIAKQKLADAAKAKAGKGK